MKFSKAARRTSLVLALGIAVAASGATASSATAVDTDATVAADPTDVVDPGFEGARWADDFARMATQIEETFPDDFADSEITSGPGAAHGTIYFRAAVPAAAASILSSVPGVSTVEGAGYTQTEVDAASAQLQMDAAQSLGVTGGVATYRTGVSHTFEVVVGETAQQAAGGGHHSGLNVSAEQAKALKEHLTKVVHLPASFDVEVTVSSARGSTARPATASTTVS